MPTDQPPTSAPPLTSEASLGATPREAAPQCASRKRIREEVCESHGSESQGSATRTPPPDGPGSSRRETDVRVPSGETAPTSAVPPTTAPPGKRSWAGTAVGCRYDKSNILSGKSRPLASPTDATGAAAATSVKRRKLVSPADATGAAAAATPETAVTEKPASTASNAKTVGHSGVPTNTDPNSAVTASVPAAVPAAAVSATPKNSPPALADTGPPTPSTDAVVLAGKTDGQVSCHRIHDITELVKWDDQAADCDCVAIASYHDKAAPRLEHGSYCTYCGEMVDRTGDIRADPKHRSGHFGKIKSFDQIPGIKTHFGVCLKRPEMKDYPGSLKAAAARLAVRLTSMVQEWAGTNLGPCDSSEVFVFLHLVYNGKVGNPIEPKWTQSTDFRVALALREFQGHKHESSCPPLETHVASPLSTASDLGEATLELTQHGLWLWWVHPVREIDKETPGSSAWSLWADSAAGIYSRIASEVFLEGEFLRHRNYTKTLSILSCELLTHVVMAATLYGKHSNPVTLGPIAGTWVHLRAMLKLAAEKMKRATKPEAWLVPRFECMAELMYSTLLLASGNAIKLEQSDLLAIKTILPTLIELAWVTEKGLKVLVLSKKQKKKN